LILRLTFSCVARAMITTARAGPPRPRRADLRG
jgi:hypothetical protein